MGKEGRKDMQKHTLEKWQKRISSSVSMTQAKKEEKKPTYTHTHTAKLLDRKIHCLHQECKFDA